MNNPPFSEVLHCNYRSPCGFIIRLMKSRSKGASLNLREIRDPLNFITGNHYKTPMSRK